MTWSSLPRRWRWCRRSLSSPRCPPSSNEPLHHQRWQGWATRQCSCCTERHSRHRPGFPKSPPSPHWLLPATMSLPSICLAMGKQGEGKPFLFKIKVINCSPHPKGRWQRGLHWGGHRCLESHRGSCHCVAFHVWRLCCALPCWLSWKGENRVGVRCFWRCLQVSGWVPVAPVSTSQGRAFFPSLSVPTMIVYGELDRSLGLSSAKDLKLIPTSTVPQVLPGAKHPAYLDQPDLWHKLLINFIKLIWRTLSRGFLDLLTYWPLIWPIAVLCCDIYTLLHPARFRFGEFKKPSGWRGGEGTCTCTMWKCQKCGKPVYFAERRQVRLEYFCLFMLLPWSNLSSHRKIKSCCYCWNADMMKATAATVVTAQQLWHDHLGKKKLYCFECSGSCHQPRSFTRGPVVCGSGGLGIGGSGCVGSSWLWSQV